MIEEKGLGNEVYELSQLENEFANVQDYDLWKLQYWPANLSNKKNAGVISDAIYTVLFKAADSR